MARNQNMPAVSARSARTEFARWGLLMAAIIGPTGCMLQEEFAVRPPLAARFEVTDTTGRTATVFPTGEEFELAFSLRNTTGETLTFVRGSSAPVIGFEIVQGDSVVASSVDGYLFAMIVSEGTLAPGGDLQGVWRAPNTPARVPKIMLTPGDYRARPRYPVFREDVVDSVAAIGFTVTR